MFFLKPANNDPPLRRAPLQVAIVAAAALALAAAALPPAAARVASGNDTPPAAVQQVEAGGTATAATSGSLSVDVPGAAPARSLSAAERSRYLLRHLELRELAAGQLGEVKGGASARPAPLGAETTEAAETDVLRTGRNNRNTRSTAVSSTLAEPAAVNEGTRVFYAGNTYASNSADGGLTWAGVNLPAGPGDAPTPCCDPDVVRAHGIDRIFSSMLYTNAGQTNGIVRIFVRSDPLAAAMCSYSIDPAGAANNVVPDYPHLAVSNGFLYLSLNNLTNGSTWTGAQIRRYNLAQMAACQTVSFNTVNWTGTVGQRILTPVEGATNVMYFGSNESATSFRIFSWPESSTSMTSVVRQVGSSNFTNPDCRGGTGNFDFIERSTAWSIAGFRLRGATGGGKVTFWWPVAPDANHPHAHLHGASVRTSDLALTDQPSVWSTTTCFSYPAVASNIFGEYGMSLAVGGRTGGGGTAARGAVLVDDNESSGIFFPTFSVTANGTHNRADGRFGDYFAVRTNSRCTSAWVATNYALLDGNTASTHVNARYVEMQSTLDPPC